MSGSRRGTGWWWRMSPRGRGTVFLTGMITVGFVIPVLAYELLRPSFSGDPSVYASLQPGPLATGPQAMQLKLVVVDTATGKMDPVFGQLPEGMQATNPAEVATVVQLAWSETLSGHYDNNPNWPAYNSNVVVTVVDVATRAVIAKDTFTNEPPGVVPVGVSGPTVAARPEEQVRDYLWHLPGPPAPMPAGMMWFVAFIIGWFIFWFGLSLALIRINWRRHGRAALRRPIP